MIGRISLVLLLSSAVPVAGQSYSDSRPGEAASQSAKASKPSKNARALPQVDDRLGNFVMTEEIASQCRDVQVSIVRARRQDLVLDRYLLKWEFSTRGDPFGMAVPYQNAPEVQAIYDEKSVGVGDCMFFQAALSRAAADLIELHVGDAKLKGTRLANARFLENHGYMLQPTVEMRAAQDDLVRDRQYRVR